MNTERKSAVVGLVAEAVIPPSRTRIKPLYEQRTYRGKLRWVVGYSWSRAGAGSVSGTVYDAILGWGESFDLAFIHAQDRLPQ